MIACIINHGRDLSQTTASLKANGIEHIIVEEGKIGPGLSEAALRNRYLRKLADGDWFLMIDSDEELMEIDKSRLRGDFCLVKMLLGKDFVLLPRLIRYREGMRYVTHYFIGKPTTYKNLSFVPNTFNRKTSYPYVATIRHLREKHSQEELEFKRQQKKMEKRTEKKMRSKGVTIL